MMLWIKNLIRRLIMYAVIKIFSKDILQPTEVIQRFHFDATGALFGFETNLAFYKLERTIA